MIENHVSQVMGRHKQRVQDVVRGTGLATNTVSGLYHGTAKRVDFETLDKLCDFFNRFEPTALQDLISYVSVSKKEGPGE